MQSYDKKGELDALKGMMQSNKHRRVQSNAGLADSSQQGLSKTVSTPQGYNSIQLQRFSSSNKTRTEDPYSFLTPNPKAEAESMPANSGSKQLTLGDMEVYAAKRIKSIMSLQTSLQTNLSRFIEMIEKCQRENSKRNFLKYHNEILRIIQDLSTHPGLGQRKTADLVKNLEELYFELQSRLETELNNRDTNFIFVTNEAQTFARITMKICNEFGCQTISLKKKLNAFFDSLSTTARDPAEVFKTQKTEPKRALVGNVMSR